MGSSKKNLKEWCNDNNKNELLEEWNSEKNSLLRFPKEVQVVEYSSPHKVHWKCNCHHEWEAPIASRTIFKLQCPICNPEMVELPIGTKYGCLTIIGNYKKYEEEVAKPQIKQFKKDKEDFLNGIKKVNSNICSAESYDRMIETWSQRKKYKCQCTCGQIQYLDEFQFLEKKHRFCRYGNDICGHKKAQQERMLATYKREYDPSYYIDYLNTFHESLEVLECVDDNFEELYCTQDKRKKGGGTFKIFKRYKCKCYLCGKEQIVKSSQLSINPPSSYGRRAYGGYYSEAYCDCHKISSFQWIVTKILKENDIPYRVEVSFPDLYGTKHVNLLRYDFSILNADGSIKCLIECQGEQHFKPVDEFGGEKQFTRQQKNDEVKREFALKEGIPLFEIPYTHKKYEKVVLFLVSKGIK